MISTVASTSLYGAPYQDPEPGLYDAAYSTGAFNFTRYNNPEVDRLLDEQRATRDEDERRELIGQVFQHLSEDLPWMPFQSLNANFPYSSDLQDVEAYGEYVLRTDLMWREG